MSKKRNRKVKAQVTIYIILGFVILFVFLALIMFSNSLTKSSLEQERENVFTKAFEKEALRIYVQDCLSDSLEEGLILIGKQGRIWSDQVGGTRVFTEGVTGINYNPGDENGRIFYGIQREDQKYSENVNAYPCETDKNFPPLFCAYEFPQSQHYGFLGLRKSTIEGDLTRYLINKTQGCVATFINNNVSKEARIETSSLDLDLTIWDQGINVNVIYPLKLKLGSEEYFHLSSFSFSYPTKINQLLDAAVAIPLEQDYSLLDYDYSESSLTAEYFNYATARITGDCENLENYNLCKRSTYYDQYAQLDLSMSKESLENGDDIFVFRSPSPNILELPQDYEFRIARQNRPPALNLLKRDDCQGEYEYLHLKNDYLNEPLEQFIPETYLGISFPKGKLSFADAVTLYKKNNSKNNLLGTEKVLGFPNANNFPESVLSLGERGTLIAKFVDNKLKSDLIYDDNGLEHADLAIFATGNYQVEISADSYHWIKLGNFTGTALINIDDNTEVNSLFGQTFSYVKIIDDGTNDYTGSKPGVNVDALGSISTVSLKESLGDLDINLFALDPDEDNVSYQFIFADDHFPFSSNLPLTNFYNQNRLFIANDDLLVGKYNLTVKALDEHGLADWQEVNLIIDRPLTSVLSINLPYLFGDALSSYSESAYSKEQNGFAYFVSKEDPVFINVTYSSDSITQSSQFQTLQYYNNENTEIMSLEISSNQPFSSSSNSLSSSLSENSAIHNCFTFPDLHSLTCNLDDFKTEDLSNWPPTQNSVEFRHFTTPTNTGVLNLSLGINYCAKNQTQMVSKSSSTATNLVVLECLPHQNPTHPWAYPYHNYTYGLTANGYTDFNNFLELQEINPFVATHSCCKSDGTIYSAEEHHLCFENPLVGCYGGSEYAQGKKGYILEKELAYCQGERGNICGGEKTYLLKDNLAICGESSISTCNVNIPENCQNKPAYSLIKDAGWCSGSLGCENLCSTAVVYLKSSPLNQFFSSSQINQMMHDNIIDGEKPLFQCGCNGADLSPCDANFDGYFNGRCNILTRQCEGDN